MLRSYKTQASQAKAIQQFRPHWKTSLQPSLGTTGTGSFRAGASHSQKASPQQVLRFNSEGYSESSLRNINWLVKKLSTHDALRLLEIQQELISLLITHGQGNIFA
ncbi:hypothetical protein [Synechococcus sp. MIT S9507]|uniref:hypothetical protein n=1 Tax=Synechococcus sp. MIT S9507 TaxID=3082544 RepID=UPI0039B48B26